jgi:hypothetical protein
MLGLNLLSTEVIGVAASVIAGLLSFVPALGKSDARRAAVAIGVLVLFVIGQNNFNFTSWQEFGSIFFTAAVYAVASYKLVLQSLVLPAIDKVLVVAGVKAKYQG